jgi:hypothetical protein
MARPQKKSRKPRTQQFGGEPLTGEELPPEPAPLTDDEAAELGRIMGDSPPPAPEKTVPKRKDDDKGSKVIPTEERRFTLDQYVRPKGDLGRSFAVSDSLANGGKVIKRTRSEWEALYETWMKAPRG